MTRKKDGFLATNLEEVIEVNSSFLLNFLEKETENNKFNGWLKVRQFWAQRKRTELELNKFM